MVLSDGYYLMGLWRLCVMSTTHVHGMRKGHESRSKYQLVIR